MTLAQTELIRQNELVVEISHLKAYARLMLNDVQLAGDAVNATLEKAIAFRDDFSLSRLPRTWPLHILRDLIVNEKHSTPLRKAVKGAWAADWATVPRKELCQALTALPFDDREAVVLVSSRIYTPFEIADVCQCDTFAVSERYRRGISLLRHFLYSHRSKRVH